jgi:hypothetical protein
MWRPFGIRHPNSLSSQRSQQIVAPLRNEPGDPMQQRDTRVGNLAIKIRAIDGQQYHRDYGKPKPSHPKD